MQSTFTFTTFKAVMGINDIPEEAYAFILRNIFDHLLTMYEISIDDFQSQEDENGETESIDLPTDLQMAIFLHAKYLYETQINNTEAVAQAKDAGGNTAVYRAPKLSSTITSIYKAYSQAPSVIL